MTVTPPGHSLFPRLWKRIYLFTRLSEVGTVCSHCPPVLSLLLGQLDYRVTTTALVQKLPNIYLPQFSLFLQSAHSPSFFIPSRLCLRFSEKRGSINRDFSHQSRHASPLMPLILPLLSLSLLLSYEMRLLSSVSQNLGLFKSWQLLPDRWVL